MPIYEYECKACGLQKDILQKLSDPVLTTCPACNEEAFVKKISAAGFRLKGSGWYETDFKSGTKKNLADNGSKSNDGKSDSTDKSASTNKSGTNKSDSAA